MLINLAGFSQVKVSTGNSGYFNVQINDGRIISYPKDVYEITEDERGGFYLQNVNGVKRIPISRNGLGVVYSSWTINGTAATSPQGLIDSLEKYVYSDDESIRINTELSAVNDVGDPVALSATQEGHLEVSIHAPRNPFGSVHAESLRPEFQSDAVYGINTQNVQATSGRAIAGVGSGTATATNNMFVCSTGTTSYSFATIQSRKRLRYRAGQGIVGRFAGLFSTPRDSTIMVAGFGTGETGFYFGYKDDTFGILYSNGGIREVQTLTITVASSNVDTVTITLGNIPFEVPVTNSGSTARTAYDIARYEYTGWKAEARGSTVVFLANDVNNKTGTFSLSSAISAAGTFAETLAGQASTDTWIFQEDWNGDKLDGTGASGYTINPQRGNVFQIGIQYLGFGTVTFFVEITTQDKNNPDFVAVHTLKFPNTLTQPHSRNPSFPFTMAAYSSGGVQSVSVSVGSFAGFIEGQKILTGPRMTYNRETSNYVGSVSSTYYPLFTIRNSLTYAGKANQAIVNLLSISGAHDDATPVTLYLIRNATLLGNPSFTQFSTNSVTFIDQAATTCTISNNEQLIYSLALGQNAGGVFAFSDDITLQPGESITLAARAVTGTATYVNASLNTREDQ